MTLPVSSSTTEGACLKNKIKEKVQLNGKKTRIFFAVIFIILHRKVLFSIVCVVASY
jgi:hypothetical protein